MGPAVTLAALVDVAVRWFDICDQ